MPKRNRSRKFVRRSRKRVKAARSRKGRMFRNVTRPPIKYVAETQAAVAVSSAMSQYRVTDTVANGTLSNQRLGEVIFTRGVRCRFQLIGTGADATNIIRIVVAAPRNIGITSAPISSTTSPIDKRFFDVRYDQRVKLVNVAGAEDVQALRQCYVRTGERVTYSGPLAGDQKTGQEWWIYVISDSAGVPHPQIAFETTYYFNDCA